MGGATSAAGLRIHSLRAGSPADSAGLQPFFDFVVSCNGSESNDEAAFTRAVRASAGKELKLMVYSLRTRTHREVVVATVRRTGTLGATVLRETMASAATDGIRILEVEPSSPASVALLEPNDDYIIGTEKGLIRNEQELEAVLRNAEQQGVAKPVNLLVYNSKMSNIRGVRLTPNRKWGGSGSLGCQIGSGLVNQIPVAPTATEFPVPRSDSTPEAGLAVPMLEQIAPPPPPTELLSPPDTGAFPSEQAPPTADKDSSWPRPGIIYAATASVRPPTLGDTRVSP